MKLPDFPSPGEDGSFQHAQAEGAIDPAPTGEMLATAAHLALTGAPVDWRELTDPAEDPASALRRAGTDFDGPPRMRSEGASSEPRLDLSARDLQRENAVDSKQDDTGPLSDKN